MMRAGDPSDASLDAHPEARVRHRAVAPQIEVPVERLDRKILREDFIFQRFVIILTLTAADAVTDEGMDLLEQAMKVAA
jgi:hypothetical protein